MEYEEMEIIKDISKTLNYIEDRLELILGKMEDILTVIKNIVR